MKEGREALVMARIHHVNLNGFKGHSLPFVAPTSGKPSGKWRSLLSATRLRTKRALNSNSRMLLALALLSCLALTMFVAL